MPQDKERDPHNRSKNIEEDEDDPVDKMLKKAGCLEKHYNIQACMLENKDWRKCQAEVKGTQLLLRVYTS